MSTNPTDLALISITTTAAPDDINDVIDEDRRCHC